ncbi:riboflavin kinase [Candidatus Kaiserbacteria bacterium]|nr:riboflavin kinase [Candidatus Kaiserbacteria bacterium]
MNTYRGTVQKGIGHAKHLGFSTINIPFTGGDITGVHAAKVAIGDTVYQAAAFVNSDRNILEAHLLDFSGEDLLGKEAVINLEKKLRDAVVFGDDVEAKEIIARDVDMVREFYKLG